jgi:hypothetical protein
MAHSALVDIQSDAFYTGWSATFRTYYNRFERQADFTINEVTSETFLAQYELYTKGEVAIRGKNQIERILKKDAKTLHFYLLSNITTKEALSGIAVVDCKSVSQSFYIAAFTRKDIAPKEAGLWLCTHWMKECRGLGIRFANLGVLWSEGQPNDWKGFSDFKMKFNPIQLKLPPELLRVTFL